MHCPAPRRLKWSEMRPGMGGPVVKFTNCRLYTKGGLAAEDLWVRHGCVIDPASRFWEAASVSEFACDLVIDCEGLILSPGFIDIQINGAYGIDFSDPHLTTADVETVCRRLLPSGVTSICPTLVSSSTETYAKCTAVFRQLEGERAAQHAAAVGEAVRSRLRGVGDCLQGGAAGALPIAAPSPGAHSPAVECPGGGKCSGGDCGEGSCVTPVDAANGGTPLVADVATGPGLGAMERSPTRLAAVDTPLSEARSAPATHSDAPPFDALALGGGAGAFACLPSSPLRPPPAPGARVLGLHLEGPFINVERKGAHAEGNLRIPTQGLASLRDTYGPLDWTSGHARIVTLAPELGKALEVVHALSQRGVVVSIGHTSADIRTADAAVDAGSRLVTHLFNAMSAFHHRDPGVVGLLGRMHGGARGRAARRYGGPALGQDPGVRRTLVASEGGGSASPPTPAPPSAVGVYAAASRGRIGATTATAPTSQPLPLLTAGGADVRGAGLHLQVKRRVSLVGPGNDTSGSSCSPASPLPHLWLDGETAPRGMSTAAMLASAHPASVGDFNGTSSAQPTLDRKLMLPLDTPAASCMHAVLPSAAAVAPAAAPLSPTAVAAASPSKPLHAHQTTATHLLIPAGTPPPLLASALARATLRTHGGAELGGIHGDAELGGASTPPTAASSSLASLVGGGGEGGLGPGAMLLPRPRFPAVKRFSLRSVAPSSVGLPGSGGLGVSEGSGGATPAPPSSVVMLGGSTPRKYPTAATFGGGPSAVGSSPAAIAGRGFPGVGSGVGGNPGGNGVHIASGDASSLGYSASVSARTPLLLSHVDPVLPPPQQHSPAGAPPPPAVLYPHSALSTAAAVASSSGKLQLFHPPGASPAHCISADLTVNDAGALLQHSSTADAATASNYAAAVAGGSLAAASLVTMPPQLLATLSRLVTPWSAVPYHLPKEYYVSCSSSGGNAEGTGSEGRHPPPPAIHHLAFPQPTVVYSTSITPRTGRSPMMGTTASEPISVPACSSGGECGVGEGGAVGESDDVPVPRVSGRILACGSSDAAAPPGLAPIRPPSFNSGSGGSCDSAAGAPPGTSPALVSPTLANTPTTDAANTRGNSLIVDHTCSGNYASSSSKTPMSPGQFLSSTLSTSRGGGPAHPPLLAAAAAGGGVLGGAGPIRVAASGAASEVSGVQFTHATGASEYDVTTAPMPQPSAPATTPPTAASSHSTPSDDLLHRPRTAPAIPALYPPPSTPTFGSSPGVIGLLSPGTDIPGADEHGRPYYSLIADGVHVHPYAVAVAYETHPRGLILVTDAMTAMGLPPGRHKLGELEVDIFHGLADGHYEGLHAVLSGTSTLAGAVVTLDKCARNLQEFTQCSVPEVLAAVTTHPARLLRLEGVLGSTAPGAWADLVLLDEGLHVMQTYVAGKLLWSGSGTEGGGAEGSAAQVLG